MRKREKQWIAEYQLNHGLKNCKECGEEYIPASGQGKSQKYCSKTCSNRVKSRYNKKMGYHKGGYPRVVPIQLWMKARGEECWTAPCYYCGIKLPPENGAFVIEHKIPRTKLEPKTKETMHDISNLEISCPRCNKLKAQKDEKAFKDEMAGNCKLDVPEHTGEEHSLKKS